MRLGVQFPYQKFKCVDIKASGYQTLVSKTYMNKPLFRNWAYRLSTTNKIVNLKLVIYTISQGRMGYCKTV